VYRTILDRKRTSKQDSYASALLEGGIDRIAKKVIEEAGEVVIASKNDVQQDVVREAADLIFHLLVLLAQRGITPQDLYEELAQRSGKSGLRQNN
jgi:phosphoribosyl-ATP pyrophosphohydrolase